MADPSILYDAEEGRWKAWWSSVVVATCADAVNEDQRTIDIFYAESEDGLTWSVQAEPALTSGQDPNAWDDTTVETPAVLKLADAPADRRYVLLYAGGNDAQYEVLGHTGWQLGLAFSADGRAFTRLPAASSPYAATSTPFSVIDGLILLGRDAFAGFPGTVPIVGGSIADPALVQVGGTYHLWFDAAGVDANGNAVVSADGTRMAYGIGHATSTDLVHWTSAAGENPVILGAGQPTVVEDDSGLFHMWYSKDSDADKAAIPSAVFPTLGFFESTSLDGTNWSAVPASREFLWDDALASEALGLINGPEVVRAGDEYRLYYGAWGTAGVPDGSCVYVWKEGAIVSEPGVFGLNVATRQAP